MSAGYFSCGRFMGEDKSGTAFFEMMEDLEKAVAKTGRKAWTAAVAKPLEALLGEQDPEDSLRVEIPVALVAALEPHVEAYRAKLSKRLGDPDPAKAPAIGKERTGTGWRLYCAWDFLRAAKACRKSRKPLVLHFD